MNIESTVPVLIVDDSRAPRQVLRKLLGELGVRLIDEATSVAGALELLAEKDFSIVLCDYYLNDGKGIEVLRHVRSEKAKSTTFLIITSDVLKDQFEEARASGVDGFLLKPFSLDQLQVTLENALKHRKTAKV